MKILSQAEQFPWRVATVKQALIPNNTRPGRIHRSDDAIDQGRLTDQEVQHLRHVLELAGRITGAVIQPGDTGSGGPMFGDDDTLREKALGPSIFGPVPNADNQAQAETGTGNGGQVPPPEPGDSGSGGGQFNPEIQLDTSTTTTSGPGASVK